MAMGPPNHAGFWLKNTLLYRHIKCKEDLESGPEGPEGPATIPCP